MYDRYSTRSALPMAVKARLTHTHTSTHTRYVSLLLSLRAANTSFVYSSSSLSSSLSLYTKKLEDVAAAARWSPFNIALPARRRTQRRIGFSDLSISP